MHVDVRIIAATNRDLLKEIEKGCFREDLYYRLSVFMIALPPLRDRKEDISSLAWHFLNFYAAKVKKHVNSFDPEFLKGLQNYEYKGNTRELKNIVERAVILSNTSTIGADLLPQAQFGSTGNGSTSSYDLHAIEKMHILRVLEIAGNNKTKAAELLDIGLTTLYRKLHEYGIE